MLISRSACLTDRGRKRANNEDAVLALGSVLALADGMGGHAHGELAAEISMLIVKERVARLETELQRLKASSGPEQRLAVTRSLEELFHIADKAVHRVMLEKEQVMGNTMVCAALGADSAFIAHVGDSRAYLLRGGELKRLTEDHTLAALRCRQGTISPEEAARHPSRHQLYQSLGQGGLDVDVLEVALADDDVLLLCSDGLYDVVDEARIAATLAADDPQEACGRLVELANEAGGPDNVSVVVARIKGSLPPAVINRRVAILRSLFLFSELSDAERLAVVPYIHERRFREEEVIVREGDPADDFMILLDGQVEVRKGELHLVTLDPGDCFGEVALVEAWTRAATVRACDFCTLYSLSRERFQELVRRRPSIGAKLTAQLLRILARRLKVVTDKLEAVEQAVHLEGEA